MLALLATSGVLLRFEAEGSDPRRQGRKRNQCCDAARKLDKCVLR